MADEVKEKPKSKGKLPIIIVLVLLLAGGGFFMMKGKGDKPKEPPLALGEKVALGDFLVNLSDGHTYLQTSIVVHMAKGKALGDGKAKEGGDKGGTDMAPLQSAVIKTLSSKSLEEVSSPEGKIKLQRELADVLNKEIEAQEAADAKDGGKDSKDKKKDDSDGKTKSDDEREHPEWDSDTGPVLRIYFTKFASQ